MSLPELIARRSQQDPSTLSLPELLAGRALFELQAAPGEGISRWVVTHLTAALTEEDAVAARDYVDQLMAYGLGPSRLLSHILPDAARRLGEGWLSDHYSFATVTHALGHLMSITRDIAPTPPQGQPGCGARVLVARAPGDDHSYGAMVAAYQLREKGWLAALDMSGDSDRILAEARAAKYDIVGLSVGSGHRVGATAALVSRLRDAVPGILIAVGGPLAQIEPDLCGVTGADIMASADAPIETVLRSRIETASA